eukprot:TRINITY_DN15554_c0_g1_i1.p1 TRINITY_DN15554_c0_g1~~TRINITY_DN15554_c0_g1_i1.p1  ORF type:complete len:187 (-),score=37.31 TRINITY_DN15554_c0_g1_i1:63-590(-)
MATVTPTPLPHVGAHCKVHRAHRIMTRFPFPQLHNLFHFAPPKPGSGARYMIPPDRVQYDLDLELLNAILGSHVKWEAIVLQGVPVDEVEKRKAAFKQIVKELKAPLFKLNQMQFIDMPMPSGRDSPDPDDSAPDDNSDDNSDDDSDDAAEREIWPRIPARKETAPEVWHDVEKK